MRSSPLDKWGGPAHRRVSLGRTSPAPHTAYKAAAAVLQLCKYVLTIAAVVAAAAWRYWQLCSSAQKRRAALAAAVVSLVLTLMLSGPMVNVETGQDDSVVTSSWLARWSRSWQRQQAPPLQPCIPPDRVTPWEVALGLAPSTKDANSSSQILPEQAEASGAQPDAGQQQQQQGQAAEVVGDHPRRLVRAYYPQQQRATLAPDRQQQAAARGWQLVPAGTTLPVRQEPPGTLPALQLESEPAPAAAVGLPNGHKDQQQLQQSDPRPQQAASLIVQSERGTLQQAPGWQQPHGRPLPHVLPHARHIAEDPQASQDAEQKPVDQQQEQQEKSVDQQDAAQQTDSGQQQQAAGAEHLEQQVIVEAVPQQAEQGEQQLQDHPQQQEGQEPLQQEGGAAAVPAASLHRRRSRRRKHAPGDKPAVTPSGEGVAASEAQGQQQQQQQQGEGQGGQQEGGRQQQEQPADQQQQQQQEALATGQQPDPQEQLQALQKAGSIPPTPEEVAAAVEGFQIAVVNDVVFHHEVTLGVVAALQKHRERLQVYVHPSVLQPTSDSLSFGLRDYIQERLPGTQLRDAHHKQGIRRADVAIFISPEFSVDYYRSFIAAARPRFVIIYVHEPTSSVKRLRYLITMHPLVASVTLSPHVAAVVTEAMKGMFTHWMMPTLPSGCNNTCWEGAALQGKFEGSRRNYARLWQDLLNARDAQRQAEQQQQQDGGGGDVRQPGHQRALLSVASNPGTSSSSSLSSLGCGHHTPWQVPATAAAPAAASILRKLLRSTPTDPALSPAADSTSTNSSSNVTQAAPVILTPAGALGAAVEGVPLVNVLGSGNPAALEVPASLWQVVRLYRRLDFADYYDTLCRSALLLPLFNTSSRYLVDKISSSVLASLAAGTPLVVPPAFLEVYTPFKQEHVVLLEEGESESAVLHRLIQGGEAATARLAATRAALGRLADHLNIQAAAKLDGIMAGGVGQPHSGPKQP